MSEEFVSECIQHKDIRHLRLYYDYLDLYHNNEHKAKIVRVLETWTNTKRTEWYKSALEKKEQGQVVPEPDFWITMSHQQFRHFMRDTVSIDTIKVNLVSLIQSGHIERRVHPENPYGPPQYRINCMKLQKALDGLAKDPFIPDIPPFEETPPEDTPQGRDTPPRKSHPSPRGCFSILPPRKSHPSPGGKNRYI